MIDNDFTRQWLDELSQDSDGSTKVGGAADMETVAPEVIADTVAWLVSDAGKHITGVALPIDDGYVNRR
jgi:NAD(P)-dependent dehydrogenase (short-subunit alcohol dehydrogenase family)